MAVKNAMTNEFLHSAYGGESMAHMRYMIWGDMALKEGFPNVKKLFEAIAFAEQVHATNHFRAIGGETTGATVTAGGIFGPNKTADNLRGAIMGELHEVEQMYPVYLNTAEFQNEADAKRSFHYALEAEKQHAMLYQMALDAVSGGKDIALNAVCICPVCGHTILNEAPDRCPVCGAMKDMYHIF
jgi:rubrerythrin